MPWHHADCAYLRLGAVVKGDCGECGEPFPWHLGSCLVWRTLWPPRAASGATQ